MFVGGREKPRPGLEHVPGGATINGLPVPHAIPSVCTRDIFLPIRIEMSTRWVHALDRGKRLCRAYGTPMEDAHILEEYELPDFVE